MLIQVLFSVNYFRDKICQTDAPQDKYRFIHKTGSSMLLEDYSGQWLRVSSFFLTQPSFLILLLKLILMFSDQESKTTFNRFFLCLLISLRKVSIEFHNKTVGLYKRFFMEKWLFKPLLIRFTLDTPNSVSLT